MQAHEANLTEKESSTGKYTDATSKEFLAEIRAKYNSWKSANEALKGPGITEKASDKAIIADRTGLLNEYKDFIDSQKYAEHFDSRSNLHSTVLEEFLYCLFRDLVLEISKDSLIGKSHTFKDIFFQAPSFVELTKNPHTRIERKDHDFVIGVQVSAIFCSKGSEKTDTVVLDVPVVALECKTYLDKTMLEGSSPAAAQLKMRNPNAIYIVVAEWLKLTEAVNLKKYAVDQVYVLRKQRNTDREFRYQPTYEKKPLDPDVIWHLYETVRRHLTRDWGGSISHGLDRGYLLD